MFDIVLKCLLSNFKRVRLSTQLIQRMVEVQPQQGQYHSSESWSHGQSQQHGHSGQSDIVIGSNQHQNLWESGKIEYTGRDSFSNIQAHLDAQLKK
jgi:hypothetical protein